MTFHLQSLFQRSRVTLSKEEIAQQLGVSLTEVEQYIQEDIEAGLIMEKGGSYFITFEGFRTLVRAIKKPI